MIWIIGGTKDSREFIKNYKFKEKLIVTTATEYGGKLLEEFKVKVFCKKLTFLEMESFVKENEISKIVDLSHPYAVEVSKNAIDTAKKLNIDYIRFERKNLEIGSENILEFEKIEDIIEYIENVEDNILVTLGSNNIEKFKNLKNLNNIYFRILPKWEMVKKAEDAGILPKNIVAMQGPFTYEMNVAMLKQLDIKYMVSKKGGDTGGELEKIEASNASGVKTILLVRPNIEYPRVYDSIEEIIEKI